MATVQSNGITIAYETSGDPLGIPVLLIMGLGMQLTAWPDAFVDGLVEQGCYVIRYDNRDSGLSSKLHQFKRPNLVLAYLKSRLGWPLAPAYTLSDMADDARGLLDALGLRQVHVLGMSMGGMVAQIVAARHAERTLSLTSIMSSSGRRGLPGPTRAARNALMSRPADPQDREQVVAHTMSVLRLVGSPAYPTPERLLRASVERAMARNVCTDGVARQMVAIAASGDRTALLATIRCPTLVIHGVADPLVPLACGEDTARSIRGAELHVIEGMGHDLPAQLNERLLALIDGHVRGKMAAHGKSQIA